MPLQQNHDPDQSRFSVRFIPLAFCLVLAFSCTCQAFLAKGVGRHRSLAFRSEKCLSAMLKNSDDGCDQWNAPSNTVARLENRDNGVTRREAMVAAAGGLTAELTWRMFVEEASLAADVEKEQTTKTRSNDMSVLPPTAFRKLEAGKAVVIPDWLSPQETRAVYADARECFRGGHYKNFILSRNPKKADRAANDRWIMPSFALSKNADGPFVDPNIGDLALRNGLKKKMAAIKAELSRGLRGRSTLSNDLAQTHEMEYLRYGRGALLNRHTDEHHLELKRPGGSRLPLKENASRRSVTWLVYLNDEWGEEDGGQLRLHERSRDAAAPVGAGERRNDLQVGWLRAIPEKNLPEQPVFLDPFRNSASDKAKAGDEYESCMLYTLDGLGVRRELSKRPFANVALQLGGGDKLARNIMVDSASDKERFHLIDAPKSLVSEIVKTAPPAGEDGGEQIRDIFPRAGTLVMFDSVSLPHEVLVTNRERFGVQGWFHEMIERPS